MRIRLKIEGMHCSGCARAVQGVLRGVGDVESVDVRLDSGEALVTAGSKVDVAALVGAVNDAGYAAAVAAD